MNKNVILIIIISVLLFGGLGSFYYEMKTRINEELQKWQAEHDLVESMSCEELKDAMLYDQIKASDNKQRATERFLGMGCEK